jgi:hypothetical protein
MSRPLTPTISRLRSLVASQRISAFPLRVPFGGKSRSSPPGAMGDSVLRHIGSSPILLALDDDKIGGMGKGAGLAALAICAFCPALAQIPCPVMLVSGSLRQDRVEVTFRNQGKLPLEELSFSCVPALRQPSHGSTCHTETGVFYPGLQYTFDFPYPGANKTRVLISVKEASQSSGATWNSRSSSSECHSLRITKGK